MSNPNGSVNRPHPAPTTDILEAAKRINKQAETHKTDIKRKLRRLLLLLGVGVVTALGAFVIIRLGLAQSEAAQASAALLLLMGLAVTLAVAAGGFLLLWTAYLTERIRRIESETAILGEPADPSAVAGAGGAADAAQAADAPPPTTSKQHERRFWLTAAHIILPSIFTLGFILLCYAAFWREMTATAPVRRLGYLLAVMPIAFAAYVGVRFYRTNQEYWTARRGRNVFSQTFLNSNEYLPNVFAGLILAAFIGLAGVFGLNARDEARRAAAEAQRRAQNDAHATERYYAYLNYRDYLERETLKSIKEHQRNQQFLVLSNEQNGFKISTTNIAPGKVRYEAKPQSGSGPAFIAEVTASSGELYLMDSSGQSPPDDKLATKFVIGEVQKVEGDVLTVRDVKGAVQEVTVTNGLNKPKQGTQVAMAVEAKDNTARKIEILEGPGRGAGASGASPAGMSLMLSWPSFGPQSDALTTPTGLRRGRPRALRVSTFISAEEFKQTSDNRAP
ncbi:MAG TPA: hypothetical protein VF546_23500 [Pyrinomonadaceae bacterium]|jgi:hypothetical protein